MSPDTAGPPWLLHPMNAQQTEDFIRTQLDAMLTAPGLRETPKKILAPSTERKMPPRPTRTLRYDTELVLAAVGIAHGIKVDEMRSKARFKAIAFARQHAYWTLRTKAKMTLDGIAKALNRSDHGTIVHGVKTFEARKHIHQDLIITVEKLLDN